MNTKGAAACLLACVTWFWGGAARSDGPTGHDLAVPCRPTVACTANLAAPGSFEIESGVVVGGTSAVTEVTTPLLLKQTIAKWLQLQVGSNGFTEESGTPGSQYFDNIVVGPKFHAWDQGGWRPAAALSLDVSLPTFSARGYQRSDNLALVSYWSKDFGPQCGNTRSGITTTMSRSGCWASRP